MAIGQMILDGIAEDLRVCNSLRKSLFGDIPFIGKIKRRFRQSKRPDQA